MAITRDDIKAIRYAGKHFGNLTAHTEGAEGKVRIHFETHKRNSADERVYTVTEQELFPEGGSSFDRTRTIAAQSRIKFYGRGTNNPSGGGTQDRGFASVYDRNVLDTLAHILRPDDELHLTWIGSNNSDALNRANWVRDEVKLHVSRKGEHYATLLLDVFVGPDNTARMLPVGAR